MIHRTRRVAFGLFTMLTIVFSGWTAAAQTPSADERFEVTSIKMARAPLLETIMALQMRDIARAKEAFDAYDGVWNGIEVYVNIRSKEMYQAIELNFQARIAKALGAPNPDIPALLADAQAMLAKYDQMIELVQKSAPLNPLYDDVARLRIVRSALREIDPALKAGNVVKARKYNDDFQDGWFNIEDFVRSRSLDAYVAIEGGMVHLSEALMPDKPDVAQVAALINAVMAQYNAVVIELMKEARNQR
jgi:hypothetical protein